MKIAVFGTGMVGTAIAGALSALGHEVTIGTRDPKATLAREEAGPMGGVPFAEWHAGHAGIAVATYAGAAAGSDIIVNATNGNGSLEALAAAGEGSHAGKIIMDIANPLDFSQGFPPSLNPVNTDSLGEQIQRAFPDARVVKTLNTMNATIMVDPASVAGGDHSVFMSGNDAGAKDVVRALLADLGHRDIIDLGDIATARGTEMLLPVWLRLWGALGHADFNFKVARAAQ